LAVSTLIAGLYGMNFPEMPVLSWACGYPTALMTMLEIDAWFFVRLRWSRWR